MAIVFFKHSSQFLRREVESLRAVAPPTLSSKEQGEARAASFGICASVCYYRLTNRFGESPRRLSTGLLSTYTQGGTNRTVKLRFGQFVIGYIVTASAETFNRLVWVSAYLWSSGRRLCASLCVSLRPSASLSALGTSTACLSSETHCLWKISEFR